MEAEDSVSNTEVKFHFIRVSGISDSGLTLSPCKGVHSSFPFCDDFKNNYSCAGFYVNYSAEGLLSEYIQIELKQVTQSPENGAVPYMENLQNSAAALQPQL